MKSAQGDLTGALKAYEDSFAIVDRLAKSDPGNAGWQRDLSVSYEKVGDVQVAAGRPRRGADLLPRQPRDCRPAGDIRPQQRRLAARSLGVVQQNRRRAGRAGRPRRGADLLPRQPRDPTAWRNPIPATPAGSAISRCRTSRWATCRSRRATSPARWPPTARPSRSETAWRNPIPATPVAARSLGVVQQIGDVQLDAGDLAGALASYRDSLAISTTGGGIRSRQRRLAARSLGVVRQHRRRAGRAGRPRRRADLLSGRPCHLDRLAGSDPGNAGWQHDLSVRTRRSATCRSRRATSPARCPPTGRPWPSPHRLATADPGNAGWQRALSVPYNRVGGRARSHGESLAGCPCRLPATPSPSIDRLAASDPGNAGWQQDLSVPNDRVGDVMVAQGI